ncbi:unnamed protein product, partial [Vitis vinifera]
MLLLSQYMAKYPYASAHYDQALPLHLCCFLDILFMFIVLSCYINYDPVLASITPLGYSSYWCILFPNFNCTPVLKIEKDTHQSI